MNQTKIERIVAGLMEHWAPPPPLKLDQWADENIVLPETQNARPGHYRTWPYLREPLNSIGAKTPEYVSIIKPSRVGFTKGLMIAVAAMAAADPCSIGLLVPVDEDARDYVVDELEPLFVSTPILRGLIIPGRLTGRNTLTRKSFRTGASLKILSARAPRRLRRHDFRVLYCDEIDAMEITVEGDPMVIAEKRTFAHADRKIVRGSTPTEEDISLIQRAYAESDQRIFEICCPHCAEWFELLWEMIQWPEGEPEKASCFCPRCGAEIEEKLKPELVELGRWRPMRPEIVNHRGYRLNALISLLPNAAWGKLAAEWLKAKRGGPAEQQVFVNLILGKPWKTSLNRLSAEALAGRVEPIGLERIPPEILLITAGADVQDDRIEVCVLGWPLAGAPAVLAHVVIDGNTLEDATWSAFDEFLRSRWPHPNGWLMKVDACAVNSGGHEGRTQRVYDFCALAAASPGLRHPRRRRGAADLDEGATGEERQKRSALHRRPRPGQDGGARVAEPRARSMPRAIPIPTRSGSQTNCRKIGSTRSPARSGGSATSAIGRSSSSPPSGAGSGSRRSTRCATPGRCVRLRRASAIDLRARAARRPQPAVGQPPPRRPSIAMWASRFNE